MSELRQQPRESTLKFVEAVKDQAMDFKAQFEECSEKLIELRERTNLLSSVYENMEDGMPKQLAARLLNDFEEERKELVKKQTHSNNNYGYYRKLADSLEEELAKF